MTTYHIPVLAEDIGKNYTKGVAILEDRRKIRTAMNTLAKLETDQAFISPRLSTLLQPMQGVYGNFAADSGAEYIRDGDIYSRPEYHVMIYGMLADLIEQIIPSESDVVIDIGVFGFPWAHLNRGEDIRTLLEGKPLTIQKAGGQSYSVTFQKIVTESQPFFATVDQMVAWKKGEFDFARASQMFASGSIMMLLMGSDTDDFAYVPQTLTGAKFDGVNKGLFALEGEVRRMVYQRTNIGITGEMAMDIMRTGKYWAHGEFHQFDEQITVMMQAYFERDVAASFERFITLFPNAQALYLSGGGVIRLGDYLIQKYQTSFQHGVHVCVNDENQPDPFWSVVEGMGKKGWKEYLKAKEG